MTPENNVENGLSYSYYTSHDSVVFAPAKVAIKNKTAKQMADLRCQLLKIPFFCNKS